MSGGSSDESEPEVEEEVTIDEYGRIGRFSDVGLKFGFRAFPRALDAENESLMRKLMRDCAAAFKARSSSSDGAYSAGNTHWIGAMDKPRCLLDQIAQSIFAFHAGRAMATELADPKRCGAEFWTLVMDTDDAVGWHWDKDYDAEQDGVNLHPHVATVTYLSDLGAPTVFLEKTVRSPVVGAPIAGPIPRGYVSWPVAGKHVSFDGRWLHGAPDELRAAQAVRGKDVAECQVPSSGPGKRRGGKRRKGGANISARKRNRETGKRAARVAPRRITFLVNVWLNRVPPGAIRIDEKLAKKLSPPLRKSPIQFAESTGLAKTAASTSTLQRSFKWRVARESGEPSFVSLKLPAELEPPRDQAAAGCLAIEFGKGDASVVEQGVARVDGGDTKV